MIIEYYFSKFDRQWEAANLLYLLKIYTECIRTLAIGTIGDGNKLIFIKIWQLTVVSSMGNSRSLEIKHIAY